MKHVSEIVPETGGRWEKPIPMPVQKPTRTQIVKAMQPLSSLRYAPTAETAHRATPVIDAMLACAVSKEHAERIVAEILETGSEWPTGYDVRQVAERTRPVETRADPGCKACGGCGFVTSQRVIAGEVYSGAVRCECWRPVKRESA